MHAFVSNWWDNLSQRHHLRQLLAPMFAVVHEQNAAVFLLVGHLPQRHHMRQLLTGTLADVSGLQLFLLLE